MQDTDAVIAGSIWQCGDSTFAWSINPLAFSLSRTVERLESPRFTHHGCDFCLLMKPPHGKHFNVYLRPVPTLHGCPSARFSVGLTCSNRHVPGLPVVKNSGLHTFTPEDAEWGFARLLPTQGLKEEDNYTVTVEFTAFCGPKVGLADMLLMGLIGQEASCNRSGFAQFHG